MGVRTVKASEELQRKYLDLYKQGLTNRAITNQLGIDRVTPYIWKAEDISFYEEYEAIRGQIYEEYSNIFLERYEEIVEELYKLIKKENIRRDDAVKIDAIKVWLANADKRLNNIPTVLDFKVEF